MARKQIPAKDAEALRYAGLMGHEFVVIVDDGPDARRCSYQGNSIGRARAYAAESKGNPAVYQRTVAGAWRCK